MLDFFIEGKDFIISCDALDYSLGVMVMQDKNMRAYDLRQLKVCKSNYLTHDLNLGTMVFARKI